MLGDRILSINDRVPRDVIEYQLLVDEPTVALMLDSGGIQREVEVEKKQRRVPMGSDVDLESLAAKTVGYTGADLTALVKDGEGLVAITMAAAEGSVNSPRKFGSAIPSPPIIGNGQSAEHTGEVGPSIP